MRNDADFVAYLAARWPFLLRSLLLIGCPPDEAQAVARTGLARCYRAWDEVLETDDVDVCVYRVVLDGWHRARRRRRSAPVPAEERPEEQPAPGPGEEPAEESEDSADSADSADSELALLRRQVEEQLAELTPEHREVLVLRYVAGLSAAQVAEVLEAPVRGVESAVPAEDLRTVSESIEVPTPPFDSVVAEARDQQRRRRRSVVASVVAAVVVVAGVGWAATRPPADEPVDSKWVVVRQPNPVDVPWYAGGLLHLAEVTVAMPAVGSLAGVNDGAVFTDTEGTVYFASSDGSVIEIGRTAADARVAVADQTDWAAWVDPSAGVPRLVVHNLVSGLDFAHLDLPESGEVVAVDQARVYYRTAEGDFQWEPSLLDPVLLDRAGLLDVESGSRVYTARRGIAIVQVIFRVTHQRPGTGALLSPGGNFVLSRAGDGSVPFRPLLYDARTGERMPSGLAGGELALDATFGPNHTVSYLVAPRAELGSAPDLDGNTESLVVLRTCDLAPVACHDVIPLARPGERPLLAH